MELKEAINCLENMISDYVISAYCEKCSNTDNCTEECYFTLAIDTVLAEIDKLNKRIEYALLFAYDYDGEYNPETKQGNAEGLAMTIDDMVTVLKGKMKGVE